MRFRRKLGLRTAFRDLWRARELVRTLTERDLRVRYKQAVLGASWAIITPVILMLVFSVFFKRVADIDTHGVPYPLFSYVGLLPWTFFAFSFNNGSQSLTSNASLLNKVYCPREVFPLASIGVASVDTLVSALVLGVLFMYYGFAPHATSVYAPLLLMVQFAFTVGVTLAVSAVLVYFRDLRQLVPLILQFGLFATPVAYGMEEIPERLRAAYSAANPLAPVIDGYRRTILLGLPPRWDLLAWGALSAFFALVGGYLLMKYLETGFADVA